MAHFCTFACYDDAALPGTPRATGASQKNGDVDLKITKAGILALCICAVPEIAFAQTMQWTDRGYVTVNVGAQTGSHDLGEAGSFPIYDETATFTSTAKVKGGALFDIGAAYKVWGHNLLAGVSYSRVSSKSDGALAGTVPDPGLFDRPRAVAKTFSGLKHSENAVHLDVIYMLPIANKIDIGISAGPTIFAVKQDSIPSLTITEPGPSVTTAVQSTSKSTVGFNAGVDVQYMLAKKWGVGALARYAVGSVSLPGATEKLTVGGFQIGVGGRWRF